MKRSQINEIYLEAAACFGRHGWAQPPNPRWDITDFGLGDFAAHGLALVNLAEEPEYCEKLMYARDGQTTPLHTHAKKKEDIICRHGTLALKAGERITLTPGIYHAFWAEGVDCIIGEVSTANDDAHDNFFANPCIGRFPEIEEDEPAKIRLLSDK